MTAADPVLLPGGFEPTGAPLGSGATAVVWPARHVVNGQCIALKVWRRPLQTQDDRRRFEDEIQRHRALARSPHVVTWLWADVPEQGLPWMATELHGRSLQDVLEAGSRPLQESLVLCQDVLDGLAAVHRAGLVHRDVKPANVLVQDGRAALCDFGIALAVGDLTRDPSAGTPGYVAPELELPGDSAPTPSTDVFSAARTLRAVLGDDVPAALEQLLCEAESAYPPDRPADGEAFAARFRALAESSDAALPRTPEAPSAGTSSPHARRTRRVWTAMGTALVLALLTGLWALQADDRAPTSAQAMQWPVEAGPDATSSGEPVILEAREWVDCEDGTQPPATSEHVVDGQVAAIATVHLDERTGQACATLDKPRGSLLHDKTTHMALTLCSGPGRCDRDWHGYGFSAGPVRVPVGTGCLSWRVSLQDRAGRWVVKDDVRSAGCD